MTLTAQAPGLSGRRSAAKAAHAKDEARRIAVDSNGRGMALGSRESECGGSGSSLYRRAQPFPAYMRDLCKACMSWATSRERILSPGDVPAKERTSDYPIWRQNSYD